MQARSGPHMATVALVHRVAVSTAARILDRARNASSTSPALTARSSGQQVTDGADKLAHPAEAGVGARPGRPSR